MSEIGTVINNLIHSNCSIIGWIEEMSGQLCDVHRILTLIHKKYHFKFDNHNDSRVVYLSLLTRATILYKRHDNYLNLTTGRRYTESVYWDELKHTTNETIKKILESLPKILKNNEFDEIHNKVLQCRDGFAHNKHHLGMDGDWASGSKTLQSYPEQLTLSNNKTTNIKRLGDCDFWGLNTAFYPQDVEQWIQLVEYRIHLLSAIHDAITASVDISDTLGALTSIRHNKKDTILQNLNDLTLEEKEHSIIKPQKQQDNPTSAQFIKNIEKDNVELNETDFESNIEKIALAKVKK